MSKPSLLELITSQVERSKFGIFDGKIEWLIAPTPKELDRVNLILAEQEKEKPVSKNRKKQTIKER